MITQNQNSMIEHTPTFRFTQDMADGSQMSISGHMSRGFIEVAMITPDGQIDHNPPFKHDGFGIATFHRNEADKIRELVDRVEKQKMQMSF